MYLDRLFEAEEAARLGRAFRRLLVHNPEGVALTGSLAMAAHLGQIPGRTIGDIDLVVAYVDGLPRSIADEFICPHVHPAAAAGRLVLQLVNSDDAVRIDVFLASGNALSRAQVHAFGHQSIPVLAMEDIAARTTVLLLKLGRGGTIAAKHAEDFILLATSVRPNLADIAWQDYRTPSDPEKFEEAARLAQRYIAERPHLLVAPSFAKDPAVRCEACGPLAHFKPARREQVLAVLGYV
jgi:hypothetical protein